MKGAVEAVWRRDLANIGSLLTPWLVTIDGAPVVSPDAPAELRRIYSELVQIGYASGWFS